MESKKQTAAMLMEIMRERRSIRHFQPTPVPQEIVLRVLEAARWGPSAHNRQPWRFVVLTSDDQKQALADAMAAQLRADLLADGVALEVIDADTRRSRERLTSAPVLIVVCMTMSDMDTYSDATKQGFEHMMATQSVAMASQNLLLMAHSEGLGAVWMCAPLFCQDEVRQTLSLPADYEPQGVIALGYPAQLFRYYTKVRKLVGRTKTRQPLETRVVFK